MADRTWFVTGAGRGLGLAFAEAVLAHGDRVIATARRPAALAARLEPYGAEALVIGLNVESSREVQASVEIALDQMGSIDVVVNNAGYGLSGTVEEVSEQQVRAQFDTNFFGALWMTQAILPHMRARRSGHIIQISSIAGITASPTIGIYAASKWALEAMSEALSGEVAPLGIKVTIVEPSGFRTDWGGSSMVRADPIAEYDRVLPARKQAFTAGSPAMTAGDPRLAASRLIDLVESPDPPLRLLLGNMAFELATAACERRLRGFMEWEAVTRSVDAPDGGIPD